MTNHEAMDIFGWIVTPAALLYAVVVIRTYLKSEYHRILKEDQDERQRRNIH